MEMNPDGGFNLQVQVELAFAPEERDVYSYERTHYSLAPLGAKPASATNAPRQAKAGALLRSFGVKKGPLAINISPPWGEATNDILLHFQVESADI